MTKTEFYRDESKLHNVPNYVPFLSFLDIVVCVISAVIWLLGVVNSNSVLVLIMSIILTLGVTLGIFFDVYFNWQINCCYSLAKPKKLQFSYNLNGYSMGDHKVIITISEVTSYKLVKDDIIIHGNIKKKQPMKKVKELSHIKLPFDFSIIAQADIVERLDEIKVQEGK